LPWQPNIKKNEQKPYESSDNFSCERDIDTDFCPKIRFSLSKKFEISHLRVQRVKGALPRQLFARLKAVILRHEPEKRATLISTITLVFLGWFL